MLSVALDYDGVLNNQFSFFDKIARRYKIADDWTSDYNGIWKVRDTEDVPLGHRIFVDHRDEFLNHVQPFSNTKEAFDRFIDNEKIIVYIVTSRNPETKTKTIEALEQVFDISSVEDIIFTKNKAEAPCQVLIDDHEKYVQQYLSNAKMGILINKPYNNNERFPYSADHLMGAYQKLLPFL